MACIKSKDSSEDTLRRSIAGVADTLSDSNPIAATRRHRSKPRTPDVCGNAEKAGEHADSAVENATQGHENLGDGPLERAGEAADRATRTERQGDAADAVSDATDGNPHTKP